MRLLPLQVLLALSIAAAAQPSSQVSALLDRLRSYSKQYREKLPSLSCDESITSQWAENGKIKQEVKIEAALREIRDDSKADPFTDQYDFKLVNGRPPKPRFKVPYMVNGVLSNGLGFAASTDQRACFDYRLTDEADGTTLRLELSAISGSLDPSCKDVYGDYRKTVIVESASGIICHITRSMSAESSRQHHEAFFISIDYGPQKLGDDTFWLPVRMEARDSDGHRQMRATFSNYERYTGQLKILPDQNEPSR